jgi:site-specific DNA-methyltransferase (adenine-specific)
LDGAVADASVDLIFADPPYNIGKNFNGRRDKWPSDEAYLAWSYQWIEVCLRKLKPNGSFYSCVRHNASLISTSTCARS